METEPKHTEQTENPFGKYSLDPDTLLTKRVRTIDGVSETLSEEAHTEEKGSSILKVTEHMQRAADGRYLPIEYFVALSWTGLPIPSDRYKGECCNPYDLHEEPRPVYIDKDGIETDNLNILCTDCKDLYKRKMKVVEWIHPLFQPIVFFFWEPEIL